ncbi:hypothetical protein DL96DRAFT_422876 [Flagelloscypha sp. PMI_526]|nr:hypothetical protein DL96DRAFT_422876 [Flagelloscypha sp. PMI_526]
MGQFDLTIGPLLVGIVFNSLLYGAVLYQYAMYLSLKYEDALPYKLVVHSLVFIDTVHVAIGIYDLWQLVVTNFGNPAYLGEAHWPTASLALFTAVPALISQTFLCHRVRILTNSLVISGGILLVCFGSFVSAFVLGIRALAATDISQWGALVPAAVSWTTLQTLGDIMITGTLIWCLQKSRTGFARTNNILNRLIRGAISTGLFTSIFALGDLLCFTLNRTTNLYIMFVWPIGRVYTITILETLIVRKRLTAVDRSTDPYHSEHQMHSLGASKDGAVPSIQVHREIMVVHDKVHLGKRGSENGYGGEESQHDDMLRDTKV